MNASDRFVMNHGEMTPRELIVWLEDAATLQDAHEHIRVKKDGWVPGASQFRQHKEVLSKCLDDLAANNETKSKELDQAVAAAQEDININANYILLRARQEKSDAWLHNNGYQLKEKLKRNYSKVIRAIACLLRAKNGPNIGEVTLSWEKDLAAGSYQLQMCKGKPQGEESYADQGYFTKIRTVVGNLERASWYYFRIRSIGNNETGPWSEPVGIIVT